MKKGVTKWCLLFSVPSILLFGSLFPQEKSKPFSSSTSSVLGSPGTSIFQVGETLEYEVGYAFIKLGKIKMEIVSREERNGQVVYKCRAAIDSSPGIPFVNLHIRYESDITESFYTLYFKEVNVGTKELVIKEFWFDYSQNACKRKFTKLDNNRKRVVYLEDTIPITDRVQDGASLFYFARGNFSPARSVSVPTVVDKEQENTHFNFKDEAQEVKIDVLDYPVAVSYFDGKAEFVGIYGLTGAFRGWFSNDQAGIPIKARMNVFIGSVYVELLRWHRPEWAPPRGGRS